MTNGAKPGNCECGAAVSFYGKKNRGWDCGRRERFDSNSWVRFANCPIPSELTAALKEVEELNKSNISLRNTISSLTEEVAGLEETVNKLLNNKGLQFSTTGAANG